MDPIDTIYTAEYYACTAHTRTTAMFARCRKRLPSIPMTNECYVSRISPGDFGCMLVKFVKQLGHSIKMRTVGSKLSGIESFDDRCKASLIIVLLTISLHVGQSAGTIHLTSGFQNHDNSLKRDPFHVSFYFFRLLTRILFHSKELSSFHKTMGSCTILISYYEGTYKRNLLSLFDGNTCMCRCKNGYTLCTWGKMHRRCK